MKIDAFVQDTKPGGASKQSFFARVKQMYHHVRLAHHKARAKYHELRTTVVVFGQKMQI